MTALIYLPSVMLIARVVRTTQRDMWSDTSFLYHFMNLTMIKCLTGNSRIAINATIGIINSSTYMTVCNTSFS